AIDDQPLAAIAVEVEVHADLAGAAERQEIKRVGIAHRGVVCGEGRGGAHRWVLWRYMRRSPQRVRSGSTVSIASVAPANKGASPPVATVRIAAPNSFLIR